MKANIVYSQEEVYPFKAKEYLEQNISNRPLRKQTIDKYAKDMKAGDWDMNGEDLIFDWNGYLRNGQHRLHALIKADVPILFGIKRGVDPATFRTMDSNVSRSPGDVFATLGHKNGNQIAAATRLVMGYEAKRVSTSGSLVLTKTELVRFFEDHPYIGDCVQQVHSHKFLLATAPIAAVMYLSNKTRHYDEQWNEFLDAFRTGANLSAASPILLLRNWALNRKQLGHHIPGDMAVIAIARAWNAYVTGNPIKVITTNKDMSQISIVGFVSKDEEKKASRKTKAA